MLADQIGLTNKIRIFTKLMEADQKIKGIRTALSKEIVNKQWKKGPKTDPCVTPIAQLN